MSGISGYSVYPFDMYYDTRVSSSSCESKNLIVTFSNDRGEWISSVEIQSSYYSGSYQYVVTEFNLYGRNSDTDEWTLLRNVTGLTYSTVVHRRRIYFPNNTPYNQLKFEKFSSGNRSSCSWVIQSVDLFADNVLVDIPNFTYDSSMTIFKDMKMTEVAPQNTEEYLDFRIFPVLPSGIVLDANTGWISGTPTVVSGTQTYTITGTKMSGGDVSATLTLTVVTCSGDKGMMRIRFYGDDYPNNNSWKLYEGRGTSGTVLQSVSGFRVFYAYFYVDFCLNNGIYRFEGANTSGYGWFVGSGYTLTVDLGEMELDMMQMDGQDSKPIYVSSVFSTYFPFQIEYTDWKVIQSDVSSDWNTVSFDDSTWNTYKAVDIPSTSSITTYIRKSFTMSGLNDYQVLNVRVKYSGGVAAYLNGNLVARFNLEDDFDSTTLSITDHDASVFSKFHVILATAGIQEGSNVFSFEIHRGLSGSSSDPVVFDATGVFGVEDCSTVVDSYSFLNSTKLESGTVADIMDLDPYTQGQLAGRKSMFIEWTVENLAGSRSNSFNILSYENITSFDFALRGFYTPENTTEEPATILKVSELDILERTKPQLSVPISMGAFRKYRWEIPWSSGGIPPLASIHMAYCKPVGAICAGEGAYPPVNEGQMSVKNCGYGYRGYSYRECTNGSLGPEVTTHCVLLPPENVRYSSTGFVFVIGQFVYTDDPLVRNIATNWEISPSLPTGLRFNSNTGKIYGVSRETAVSTTYSITARNDVGSASTQISIEVIPEFIIFPQTMLVLGKGIPFTLTPTLDRTAVVSVFSGSLPAGLTVNPSTGVICGTPTERVSSQSVTINAQSDGASQKVVLTFTVLLPLSAFSYPQSTYILPRSQSFSDTPLITGDVPVYSIESGELPPGLTLDSMNGMIYGSPSQSITDQNVVIKAENAVSNQTFPLSFTTRILPTVLHYSQDVYYTPINSLFSISPECDGDYIQYSLIDGTLPSGLSFSTSSGVIEGSPVNSTQIMVLTVNATNEVGSVQVVISICVRIPLSLFQYPKSSYRLVRGKSFTVIPSVQGDAPRFRMTSSVLPDGIQLNEMTGEISGIPSTLGDPIDVTIQVWNEVGSEETTLTLVVKRFTILAIVLMIIGGVILFCFVVLVMGRMV